MNTEKLSCHQRSALLIQDVCLDFCFTALAEIFVDDLISYILYFWVRNLVAYENHVRIPMYYPGQKKTATTIMHKIRTLFLSWGIEKSSLIALWCAAMREVAASRATVPIS